MASTQELSFIASFHDFGSSCDTILIVSQLITRLHTALDISYYVLLGMGIMNPHFRIIRHTFIYTQIGKINNQL
ncbi:hypothetical protein Hanom_Chr07g00582321 [Helianthus anomalus]